MSCVALAAASPFLYFVALVVDLVIIRTSPAGKGIATLPTHIILRITTPSPCPYLGHFHFPSWFGFCRLRAGFPTRLPGMLDIKLHSHWQDVSNTLTRRCHAAAAFTLCKNSLLTTRLPIQARHVHTPARL